MSFPNIRLLNNITLQNGHVEDPWPFSSARKVINPLRFTSVKDCDLDLVELGHSERRFHFGETDETVGLKTRAAVRHGLIPLICIGETLSERESGRADEILKAQVEAAFSLLEGQNRNAEVLLAYEPVWAIGVNGVPATADYATARHRMISKVAHDVMGRPIPVLYGGSVNEENCAELISQDHIDGLFIGRAAWNVKGYLKILDTVASVTASTA